ncbi:MAG TPA: hypothetical protein PKM25_03980 [Candidatus Ozemobacteraceae bacterium]|nr:hypothetical protein [Candidatus Ozemobacteraceae bacterium]
MIDGLRSAGPAAGKLLLMLCLVGMIVGLYGCGGGGGGGDGGDADPLAPEIGAQVDGFVNAVNAGNVVGNDPSCAMYYIDTNIDYYRTGGAAASNYSGFRDYLQAFVNASTNVRFSIDGREYTSNGETWALCAGTLNCSWTDSQGNAKTLSEPVQIEWQLVSRWGILKFSRHDVTGLQFPPSP